MNDEPQTQEEAEVLADEQAAPEGLTEDDQASAGDKTEYVEFLGTDPKYGTEFYGTTGTHTITRKQMKDNHDIDLGAKELVWKAGKNGRFLVPVADMSPEAAEYLSSDPMFKRVTL